jgi:hypothetical protein
MTTRAGLFVNCIVTFTPLFTGCATPSGALSPSSYSARSVFGTDPHAVLDVAEAALIEHGFSIARRDARTASITTIPIDIEPDPDSRVLRARQQARTRKVAEVRVETLGGDMRVYCRVAIQEQTTEAHRLLAYDRASSDVPHDTPIDRGAYATPEQSTVWQMIRRDGAAERAILASVTRRTDTPTPASP